MRLFRGRTTKAPPPLKAKAFNPRRRLRNLQKKRTEVVEQLANRNLGAEHRPRIESRLASIEDEIATLRETL